MSGGIQSLILSASTGTPQGSLSAATSPAVANGVLFAFSNSTLNAVGADGFGTLNWSVPGNSSIFSTSPLVVGGDVFGGTNAGLSEFDAATGATVWSAGVGPAALAASNGTLVVAAGNSSTVGQPSTLVAYRNAGPITDPPSNQAQPTVEGPADLSGLQAADVGIWSGLPSAYSYQWQLCDDTGANCTDIAGATNSSYLPSDDEIGVGATLRVRIVATNGVGSSAPVESAPSTDAPLVVNKQQALRAPGRGVHGAATVGQQLSTTNGIWTNDPTGYTYKWQRCDSNGQNCTDISGATSPKYTVVSADLGFEIRSEVLAKNAVGPAATYAGSPPTSLVRPAPLTPGFVSAPIVTGTALLGSTLSTTTGTWTNSPTSYEYKWQRCDNTGANCSDILNATSSHYTLAKADVGHEIRSEVRADNTYGPAQTYAPSAPTSTVIAGKPTVVNLPKVSGTAKVGQTLAVRTGTWKNTPTGYTYQWLRCTSAGTSCKKIAGATSSSYLLTSADAGHKLKATVTAANAAGSTTATTSNASAKVKS